jgi:hypothetical protein
MMPHQPNPLTLAETAQRMAAKAEEGDAKIFQKVALVSMSVMALSSAAQVVLELLRRKETHCHDRDEASRRWR